MSTDKYILREIQPSDSNQLAKLVTEFEDDLTTHFQVDPYQAIVFGTENRTTGVVVEALGEAGFIGMGTVRFSTVRFNDEFLPLAFLDGLKVRKEFRGKGLGYKIANWRVQKAREEFGDQCIIGTGMLHDNHASHAVARKWCTEYIESGVDVFIMPVRTRSPRSIPGITVREIVQREYEEFADKQNKYYRQHNLFPPCSPNSIANACSVAVEGRQPYRYFVAVDGSHNLVAGAQTWARGMLKADTVNNLPNTMRALNKIVHLLPPDFTIRDVSVIGLWHETGHADTAQYLWEMIRWLSKDRGTTLTAAFDVRDPTAKIVALKPWHQPRPKITLAIHSPSPLNNEQFLFAIGRV
jgi:GNAT superfamily N-acetyltransferase